MVLMGVLISWLIFARKRDFAELALSASSLASWISEYCFFMTVPVRKRQTAIPIAASGEIIDRQCIELFKRYDIDKVLVVRQ